MCSSDLAGAVRDRVGDVAGQHRYDQREGARGADREECVPKGSRVGFVPRVDAAEGEPEGDQEAARDDEGKHERDSGHQVLVRPGLPLGCRRLGGRLFRVSRLNRRLRERLTDQGLAGRDRRLRRRGEDPLADEAAAFHLLVRGDEDEGQSCLESSRYDCLQRESGWRLV